MSKIINKKRYWLLLILCLLLGIALWQRNWTVYLYTQAKGGLNVAFNTRPLAEVLHDPKVPDSLKARIRLISEIKRYAIDSLGLKDNPDVYQTLFDQQSKPLVYLVTAAEPYKMEAVEFHFPIIGNFTYKGFFDSTMAAQELKIWQQKGYDTDLGQGIAYSTLGWLPEPILSSMLFYSEGKLASLIIHEMTHGTIFVKNEHETSENLANFIGEYGAKRYLKAKYGIESEEYQKFARGKEWRKVLVTHLNKSTLALDSLYKTFKPEYTKTYKDSLKYTFIRKIVVKEDSLYAQLSHKPLLSSKLKNEDLPNNAYFVGFKTYHSKQNEFEQIFEKQFRGDFRKFLEYLEKRFE